MPITKANTHNPIRGRLVPNAHQKGACYAVMAQLAFADLGRGAGTLHTIGTARLDMQGQTREGDANLQVQIGTQTVAAVMVAKSLQAAPDAMNQKGVSNAVNSVLNQSMDTGTVWTLTGSLP